MNTHNYTLIREVIRPIHQQGECRGNSVTYILLVQETKTSKLSKRNLSQQAVPIAKAFRSPERVTVHR